MGRKSFGMIALVIVMGVVLLLVSGAWRQIAPTATDVTGAELPAGQFGGGERPKLKETQERTDAHSDRLREALATSE